MKVSEYIVDFLAGYGVTDTFGIPGGVILELIYAFERHEGITPHLCYHEQSAGFAACGYAQVSGRIGVAYATRGPGFTNLISAIADAYSDSIPVMFITGHSCKTLDSTVRVVADQELDTCNIVESITKYAVRIDGVEILTEELRKAYNIAMSGRKGPVFLDISSSIWKKDVDEEKNHDVKSTTPALSDDARNIAYQICNAKRPVFLIGDGLHQSKTEMYFHDLSSLVGIPVISSRYSHDIVGGKDYYFGYIGSHGVRTANFILSKSDLIISLGNRLNFPLDSDSYKPFVEMTHFLRVETDPGELKRHIPNSSVYHVDLESLFIGLIDSELDFGYHQDWMDVCKELKQQLAEDDLNDAVSSIEGELKTISDDTIVVNDVGNNEFWVSRACVHLGITNRTLYSKSFGALGCGLGKAIGAYYATKHPIVCFVGDQGIQMNIQELQTIVQNNLPIRVVLLNNHISGMIKDRESLLYNGMYLHTTRGSGYCTPDFAMIAKGYGLDDSRFVEIDIDENIGLTPQLPKGNSIQKMMPSLDEIKYNYLNEL